MKRSSRLPSTRLGAIATTLLLAACVGEVSPAPERLASGRNGGGGDDSDGKAEPSTRDGATSGTSDPCAPTAAASDPAATTDLAVGISSYSAGTIALAGTKVRLQAAVWYPATNPGADTPIATNAKLPIVFVLHGNHENVRSGATTLCASSVSASLARDTNARELPSHLGYEYFARNLAAAGVVVVSINANDINCQNGSFIDERATLIMEHVRLIATATTANGATVPAIVTKLRDRVDITKVGLAGHSRGGEAAAAAARRTPPAGASIRGVMAIAPSDLQGYSLDGTPLFVVIGSADGDIAKNPGMKFYDRAKKGSAGAEWFKAQQYVYGANHDFFNTEWHDSGLVNGYVKPGGDDGIDNGENRLTAEVQRKYTTTMARAFFDAVLGGVPGMREIVAGTAPVSGLDGLRIWPSFTDRQDYIQLPTGPSATGFDTFGAYAFVEAGAETFNGSFFHDTSGYVGVWSEPRPELQIAQPMDLSRTDHLSFRVAQIARTSANRGADVDMELEVVDRAGQRAVLRSNELGVHVPAPYARPPWKLRNNDGSQPHTVDVTKTVLGTWRIATACLARKNPALSLRDIVAIRVRPLAPTGALAFADFQ